MALLLSDMEHLAQVRIVAWEGASLWLLKTMTANTGPTPRTDFHAHHAVQIVLGLGGRFRLWTADAEAVEPCAAIAPDVPHRFEAQGAYAILFVEPESRAGRAIMAATFGTRPLCVLPATLFEGLDEHLAALGRSPPPANSELIAAGRAIIDLIAGEMGAKRIDPRVQRVVAWAARAHDERIDLGAAAGIAGLSPGRLSHLFVEQTGLSFRTYLLWLRLTRAVGLMAEGLNLTSAAHGAGFSDSAHFSRTFRRMFGVTPASLTLV